MDVGAKLKGAERAGLRAALAPLIVLGAEIAVRVSPGASRNGVSLVDGVLRVSVTQVAEGGKANASVQALLAKALGVAKTRLVLIRGEKGRDKVFRVE